MPAGAAYKSILVHVAADAACDARLALAVELARRSEGRVIGAGGEIFYGGLSAPGGYMDAKTVQMLLEYAQERLDRAGARFMAAAAAAGVPAVWRGRLERPETVIADEARGADLIVASQHGGAGADEPPIDPGELIMAGGLPVLVVPPDVDRLAARRILLGWKNTLQARSAISVALPLLTAADAVEVVRIADDEANAQVELADVAERLRLHGVKVSCAAERRERRAVAQSLVDRARNHNADLIVAGAYAQPRLHQWVFGGVTRDLLARSTLPVLYAR
ncbi:MAG TPA: universal stress protein [Caulobacteraceae bacterium]|nr:universal stress protein [Caulobacteraceae bacterium]